MKRRQACIGALGLSLGRRLALAQQPAKKVFRVGVLSQANVEQNEFFFMLDSGAGECHEQPTQPTHAFSPDRMAKTLAGPN